MKKVIISLFIVTILVLVNKNDTKVLIPDNAIRFRIIANSNSIEDQKEKIEIRNELEPILADVLTNSNTKEETKNEINLNMNKINNLLKKYEKNYDINYGLNFFPEKKYRGVTYKEGNYESLVVTLGDGLGDNWWCVLFPPLCLLEANEDNFDDITYTSYLQELINKADVIKEKIQNEIIEQEGKSSNGKLTESQIDNILSKYGTVNGRR